jgi:hypothetical protein
MIKMKGLSLLLALPCDAHCSVELVASARFHHLPNTQRLCKCRTRGNLLARRLRQNVGVVKARSRRHGVSGKTIAPLLRPRDGVFKAIADVLNWQLQLARSKEHCLKEVGRTFYFKIFGIICVFLGPPSLFSTESCDFPVSHTLPPSTNSKATIYFFFNLPNRFCVLFDLFRFTRTLDTTAGVSVFVDAAPRPKPPRKCCNLVARQREYDEKAEWMLRLNRARFY